MKSIPTNKIVKTHAHVHAPVAAYAQSCEYFDFLEYHELSMLERDQANYYKKHLRECEQCQKNLQGHQEIDAHILNSFAKFDYKEIDNDRLVDELDEIKNSIFHLNNSWAHIIMRPFVPLKQIIHKLLQNEWSKYVFVALASALFMKFLKF